jgi:putative oxidoreductase
MEAGLLLIHLIIGATLAAHGSQKLFGWLGGYGIEGTGGYLESFGLRHGSLMALAAGSSELVGGLLFAAGFLTPLAAALIAGTMLVAARTDHAGKGFWIYNGGNEYVVTVTAVVIGLAFNGAGAWSLDAALDLNLDGVAWGLGALAAAAIGAGGVLTLSRERRCSVGPVVLNRLGVACPVGSEDQQLEA